MEGTSYYADTSLKLYYGKGEVRFYYDNELLCFEKEFSFKDNVLEFGNDEDKIAMLYQDNKFYLQDSWIDGKFFEFSEDNIEFVVVYDWIETSNSYEDCNKIETTRYDSMEGGLKPGYYYNRDLSTELVIRENGVAEFYSDTDTAQYKNVVGRYECVDGQMILKRVMRQKSLEILLGYFYIVDDYVFVINDDKLVYTQYTDMYKNTTKYDESENNTLYYSEKSLINRIKPGQYLFEEENSLYDFSLWFDNAGTVSVHMDDMSFFMGTYENNNGSISITLDNGKELSALVKDGSVFVSDIICLDNNCPVSGEIECKNMGLSKLHYIYHRR